MSQDIIDFKWFLNYNPFSLSN